MDLMAAGWPATGWPAGGPGKMRRSRTKGLPVPKVGERTGADGPVTHDVRVPCPVPSLNGAMTRVPWAGGCGSDVSQTHGRSLDPLGPIITSHISTTSTEVCDEVVVLLVSTNMIVLAAPMSLRTSMSLFCFFLLDV